MTRRKLVGLVPISYRNPLVDDDNAHLLYHESSAHGNI